MGLLRKSKSSDEQTLQDRELLQLIDDELGMGRPVGFKNKVHKLPFSWLLTTTGGRGLVIIAASLVLGLTMLKPDWLFQFFQTTSEEILIAFGLGFPILFGWIIIFIFLSYYRFKIALRRWRLLIGSATLIVALQGILAYFQGPLPLLENANWGGDFGQLVHGSIPYQSYLRVALVTAIGVWIVAPGRSLTTLGKLIKLLYALPTGLISLKKIKKEKVVREPGSSRMNKAPSKSMKNVDNQYLNEKQMVAQLEELFAEENQKAQSSPSLENALSELEYHDSIRALPDPQSLTSSTAQGTGEEQLTSNVVGPDAIDMLEDIQRIQGVVWNDSVDVQIRSNVDDDPKKNEKHERKGATKEKPKANTFVERNLSWVLPSASEIFVQGRPPVANQEELNSTARLIENTLAQHGVDVSVAEIRPGPSVTMFGLVPGWRRIGRAQDDSQQRVRVDSILAREKDLALALAAPSLRIEAPVPGESVVGVEVPNQTSSVVNIRTVMESSAYDETLKRGGLSVALGQGSVGEPMALDLLRMPHLLIAGATGSGKSVCIHSIIGSIITHQQPSQVRLILIDPKRVELTPYNGIPHLAIPVVVEPDKTVKLLKAAVQEMLRRYQLLEEIGVRNLQSYNRSPKAKEPIPYLIICVDELADLMMASSYEIERNICRLAQLGRATGIHLVVATQRPSVDVVTGLIKANFPSRISFAVASQTDSRTILDTGGAERLLGRGDMLFISAESAKPSRVQGAFIGEEETEELAKYWRNQNGPTLPAVPIVDYMMQAEESELAYTGDGESGNGSQDVLFQKAVDMAGRHNQLSTSLLQRRLRIGYPRAARLMDELEDAGVVGPGEPGKPREVLYRYDDRDE